MSEFNWTCPFCQHAQTVSDSKSSFDDRRFYIGETRQGMVGMRHSVIGCSNSECKEFSVIIELGTFKSVGNGGLAFDESLSVHWLRPDSDAKPIPDYVPKSIIDDYTEACKIKYLSPKAAATLSRRCLQGMIRDFCGITKSRLIDEIDTLRQQVEGGKAASGVTAESIDAIDGIRKIGNIGAHMEKDINVIVDVDPNEAQALIELVELLIDEWYIARNKRLEKLARVKAIADAKNEQKNSI